MSKLKFYFFIFLGTLSFIFPAFAIPEAGNNKDAILAISDIHFDPFIVCKQTKISPCPLIVELNRANPRDWETILNKYDIKTDYYKEDTSNVLLNSSLSAAKKVANDKKPKLIFMLGDELGHEYRNYYKQYTHDKSYRGFQLFVKKTMTFLTLQLAKTFPNQSVYSVIGNNDSYLGDYVSIANDTFYKDTGTIWSGLIKNPLTRNSMQKQFSKEGYYAVDVPNLPPLKLIVLNSVLFSYKAKGTGVAAAAEEELQWLHQQLESAVSKKQKVIILMHIPMSYDIHVAKGIKLFTLFNLWHEKYIEIFKEDLNTYSDTIADIFTSHLHADWQQTFEAGNGDTIPVLGAPSISPIFGNDPAFKIYFYDPQTFDVTDSITYTYLMRRGDAWVSAHADRSAVSQSLIG